ncbi:hypothetical protein [Mycobacterium kyogaense]|uniref:hypothetical protein n=1 Tax=Mycobacterium kyogaense TaxID=2212479 RepID=UPI0013C4239D|nr:hypothetical protein [Mycobacterium kyogaense]
MQIAILALIMLFLARDCLRQRNWMPLVMLAGGAIALLSEPVVDIAGLIWYPPEGAWAIMHVDGRAVPWLCLFGYIWLYPGLGAIVYIMIRNGAGRADIWKFWVGLMVFLMVGVEFYGSGTGVYHYYGDQPLKVFDYSMYWGFINASSTVLTGVLAWALREHLTGWRTLLSVAIAPLAVGASFFGGGSPTFVVLNSGPHAWYVTQGAGLLTCAICSIGVWMALRAVPAQRTAASAKDFLSSAPVSRRIPVGR